MKGLLGEDIVILVVTFFRLSGLLGSLVGEAIQLLVLARLGSVELIQARWLFNIGFVRTGLIRNWFISS